MKITYTLLIVLFLLVSCSSEETNKECPCGSENQNRFTSNAITKQKSVFETTGYTYHFCSTKDGDLFSGYENGSVNECSSLLKTVGFDFTVKSDPLGSFTENALGADLFVIVVNNENEVLELSHPSSSTWASVSISGEVQAKGSIASYWSSDLRYHYVYFVGVDGGLYATFKDTLNADEWTAPNNLLPLVGLGNVASEITSASISVGTNGDDLFISFKSTNNEEVKLVHMSTEQWKIL